MPSLSNVFSQPPQSKAGKFLMNISDIPRRAGQAIGDTVQLGKQIGQGTLDVLRAPVRAAASASLTALGVKEGTPQGTLQRAFLGKEPIRDIPGTGRQTAETFGVSPQTAQRMALPLGVFLTTIDAIPAIGGGGKAARKAAERTAKELIGKTAVKEFRGFTNLTTKFLDYAKGKTTLSRQEILDFARRPELKKGEADLLNRLGSEVKDAKVPAQEFADSIRRDLFELKPVKVKPNYYKSFGEGGYPDVPASYPFENIRIKTGNPKNYEEVVFESPITTNGSSHYPNSKNYFAHARGDEVVESGKKIWREQEIQSDLLQKDNVAQQLRVATRNEGTMNYKGIADKTDSLYKEFQEKDRLLSPFTNDRFGERIMRERIKEKAQQGYEKYRLPTGSTISKIEGHDIGNWATLPEGGGFGAKLKPEDLKLGQTVQHNNDTEWIITNVLGEGRFKAIPKDAIGGMEDELAKFGFSPDDAISALVKGDKEAQKIFGGAIENETFDLTGKSNPQYRRYSDWGKFLKNKFGGKEVTDPEGNKWTEIDLRKEQGRLPVEAFGIIPLLPFTSQQNQEK